MLALNKQVMLSVDTNLDNPETRRVTFFTASNNIFYLELAMDKTEFIRIHDGGVQEVDPDELIAQAKQSAKPAPAAAPASNETICWIPSASDGRGCKMKRPPRGGLTCWGGSEVVKQPGAEAKRPGIVEVDVGVGAGVGRGEGGGKGVDTEQVVPEEGAIEGELAGIGALAEQGIRLVILALAGVEVAHDGPLGARLA
jgi:hypothetical protein